jgi:hypothetical protein
LHARPANSANSANVAVLSLMSLKVFRRTRTLPITLFSMESERHAKEADKDGKGYLDQEEARSLGTKITDLGHKITDLSQANTNIRRILWFLMMLVTLLLGTTIAAGYLAIRASGDTVVNESGRLEAADGSGDVAVKSQGTKIFTYNVQGSNGTKVCVTASDLALAWYENENGGVATFIVQNDVGDEQILRLSSTDTRMTQDVVSFGDLELYPDLECNLGGDSSTSTSGDGNRNLIEHVRSLREGTWNQRNLKTFDLFGRKPKKPKKSPPVASTDDTKPVASTDVVAFAMQSGGICS